MAAGDIKGQEVVVIYGTLGATTTLGEVVHLETDDGYWDPVAANDSGKFGVALEAGDAADEVPIAIWGRVEADVSGTILKGQLLEAVSTGYAGAAGFEETLVANTIIGTAMEAQTGDNKTATIWVGLVG